MKKLDKYRKSLVNQINITYNGERFEFNLFDEVSIDEDALEDEAFRQPSYYGFLLLLHKKLRTQFETLKQLRKKIYSELLIRAKSKQIGNRYYNDDTAKAWVERHPRYRKITKRCIKAKNDEDMIYACVASFQQRKDLLQTISANQRKEK